MKDKISPIVEIIQTSDAEQYVNMLSLGRDVNQLYARYQQLDYSYFVGIKRGFFPWHATFNRILILHERFLAGYTGWLFYLDADAYVYDLAFDLKHYLTQHEDKALIAAAGGETGESWDINIGVFLINLAHREANRLIEAWYNNFMSTSDDELRDAEHWEDIQEDQSRLHDILRSDPAFVESLHLEDRMFLNDSLASFVRQNMRVPNQSMEERLSLMRDSLREARDKSGLFAPRAASESVETAHLVNNLYEIVLGRGADDLGRKAYTELIENVGLAKGVPMMVGSLMASEEFLNRFGRVAAEVIQPRKI